MIPLNQVILGDCVKVLKDFPENSIDCVVTDPPYGLSFMGKEWDKALPPKAAFVEICRALKPGALAFIMSSPRQDLMWRMAQLLEESGFELGQSFISWVYASGFPKAYDISKNIDKNLGLEREVIGKGYAGFLEKNKVFEVNNPGYGSFDITEPASPEAKQWEGWKSVAGLKPALEVIFMVQKPLSEKTIVDNVLKWGTGAMNVDSCRIPFNSENDEEKTQYRPTGGNPHPMDWDKEIKEPEWINTSEGRFPANLLVSDDALNDGKDHPSGTGMKGTLNKPLTSKIYGQYEGLIQEGIGGDAGSFSRYFDLDAWAKHHGFLNVPKASTGERDQGLYGFEKKEGGVLMGSVEGELNKRTGGKPPIVKNIHPTVKPVELMAYLIELGCPPSGVVLDPFLGSGTTCVAARMLGRDYIGIEISEEYHKIALARVSSTPRLTTLDRY